MYKANIQGNQEQGSRHPRLIGRSTWNNREEGLGFYAGILGDMDVLREGTPPNKVNQGKTKVTQSKSKNPKRNQGKTNGDQGEPRKNEVK